MPMLANKVSLIYYILDLTLSNNSEKISMKDQFHILKLAILFIVMYSMVIKVWV